MSTAARWWHRLDDGRLQCDLCPRDCRLHEGQRGFCFVRQRRADTMELTTWGRSSGFAVDPIEKKPLAHFYPGTPVLSFGTAGCNLGCRFCQNWDISKAREWDTLSATATPSAIAERARQLGCKSVAFTYNDPVIFAEYAMDVADACHEVGVKTVAVTAGYIRAAPRAEFFSKMDAANVDLKAFSEEFYRKVTFSHLAPVLETLEYLVHHTSCWTEVTTLLIPGHNDSEAEIAAMCEWWMKHLKPTVPLHLSAFHPDFKMTDVAATPKATLLRARDQALAAGLKHVYVGNVHHVPADTTYCAGCGEALIVRDWYELLEYRLTTDAVCSRCRAPLAGHYDARPGTFGRKRLSVSVG